MCLIGGILSRGAKWVRKLRECGGRYLDIKEVMWPRLEYLGTSSAPVSLNQQLFAHSPSPSKGVLFTLESLGSTVMWNSGRLVLSPGRFTHPPSHFLSADHRGGVLVRQTFIVPNAAYQKEITPFQGADWELVQSLPALKQLTLSTFQQANGNLRKSCRLPHKLVRDAVGLDLEAGCSIMCLWSPICALCCELDSRGPFLFEVSPCQRVVRCVLGNAPPPTTAATACLCQIWFLGLGRVGRRKQGCRSVNSSKGRLNMPLAFHQPSSLMSAFLVQSLRDGEEGWRNSPSGCKKSTIFETSGWYFFLKNGKGTIRNCFLCFRDIYSLYISHH